MAKQKPTKTVKPPVATVTRKPGKLSSSTSGYSKKYTPADERTGAKGYGPESKTKPTPKFVKDAQAKKKDITMKDGKPYRAGYTETKESKPSFKYEMPNPKLSFTKPVEPKPTTKSSKTKGKLKPMGMTYGVNKPDYAGTKYKKKVRK